MIHCPSLALRRQMASTMQGRSYSDANGKIHGFLYSSGTYTTINYPNLPNGSPGTHITGINDTGLLVGYFAQTNDTIDALGFNFNAGTSVVSTLPSQGGSLSTVALGINDNGQIVGTEFRYDAGFFSGFIYENGAYTVLNDSLSYPGRQLTHASAINDSGLVVGYYDSSDSFGGLVQNGFLFSGGSFTTINDPQGRSTNITGINNAGQFVGHFTDTNGKEHGFFFSNGAYLTIDNPLESVRRDHAGLHSFRSMRRIEARRRNASPFRFKHSQSFASLLHLPNHAKVRSTTHRLGNMTKPLAASERLTISTLTCFMTFLTAARNSGP